MISVTSSAIYIDGGNYSFEDIYNEIQKSTYSQKAKKIGDRSYYFDFDFYIGKDEPASIEDKNISVEVTSYYFQVYENSYLKLGSKSNKKVLDGCYFYAPNLALGYGFGCKDKDDIYTLSGNLFLYGTYIEAPCFWGFFNRPDKQVVEIEDCLIVGFGRISGNDSYVKNATYLNVDKKYGSISVLGEVAYLDNITVNNVLDDGYALYFNPDISGDCTVENFKAYNYDNLIYCESSAEEKTFSLINAEINDLNVYFKDDNSIILLKNRIYFKYTNEDTVVKIAYQGEMVDTLILKDRNYSDLTYIKKTKNSEKKYEGYSVTINDEITFNITPDKTFTIDVDSYDAGTIDNSNTKTFLIPNKIAVLGSIFSFFLFSTSEPTIELRKSNNNKIDDPYEIKKINDSLYRVSFLIGELAEESSTGEIWQDGVYLLYCNINNKECWESVEIQRDNTEDENSGDTSSGGETQQVSYDDNSSSGAKIYM